MTPPRREDLLSEAGAAKLRAARLLALGDAEDRWEATALLREAAAREIAALEALGDAPPAERASALVEACGLYLSAKDPVRAARSWAFLPREAFSGAPAPADAIDPLYGEAVSAFSRAWREVLGPSPGIPLTDVRPDQLRALLDTYPGVPELWWALSRSARSAGESHLALSRATRMEPSLSDPAVAQTAWQDIDASLYFHFRVDLSPERKGAAPTLETLGRIVTALSELIAVFAEKTTDVLPALVPAVAPCSAGSRFVLHVAADGLHPFVLRDLDADLRSTMGRSDARARLALLSLLAEHRIRLTATPTAPASQPGLLIDEPSRRSLVELADAAALTTVDSRDVPQADDVERVFRTVERIVKGKGDLADLSPRQISYYRRAAKILGLLDERDRPTPAGQLIARLDREPRLRAAAVHFESSACGDAWIRWSGGRTLLDVRAASAVDFLRTSVPGLSKDTCERRAQTLVSWHKALSLHHYAKAPPPR